MTPSAGKHAHRVIVVGAALVALTLAAPCRSCDPAASAAGAQAPAAGTRTLARSRVPSTPTRSTARPDAEDEGGAGGRPQGLLALRGPEVPDARLLRRHAQPHVELGRRLHGRQHADAGAGLPLRARRGGGLLHRHPGEALAAARLPRRRRPRRGPRPDVPAPGGQPGARHPTRWPRSGPRPSRAARRRRRPPTAERGHRRQAHRHAAQDVQGPEGRRPDHEVGVAAVHGDGGEVQRAGPVHRDDRLRVDVGAGRQQPAPQRHLPRRQGQGRPGVPVLLLEQRGPREALGVDGGVRDEDGRPAHRHPAQRQPLQRPDVRARGLRRQAAHEGVRGEAGALRGAAGDHPDEGQQRDAPDDVAERRVRGRHGRSPAGSTAT